jgi:hypothetical protein
LVPKGNSTEDGIENINVGILYTEAWLYAVALKRQRKRIKDTDNLLCQCDTTKSE